MRCLYCGKELALLKRWTGGGEFCSDVHRQRYQEEYNQLALNRLLQAKPPAKSDKAAAEKPASEAAPAKPSPLVETAHAEPVKQAAVHSEPVTVARVAETPKITESPKPAYRELTPTAARVESPLVTSPVVEAPPPPKPEVAAPAEAAGFFVEMPVAVLAEVAPMSRPDMEFLDAVAAALPNHSFEPLNGQGSNYQLGTAGLLTFQPSNRASNYTVNGTRERRLEVRDFVRTNPVVEIDLSPAGETGLETTSEAMDILIIPQPPQGLPIPWQEPPVRFAAAGTELGDLARLAFTTTGFSGQDESREDGSGEWAKHSAVAMEEPPAVGIEAPLDAAEHEVALAPAIEEPPVAVQPEAAAPAAEPEPVQVVEPPVVAQVVEQKVGPVIEPKAEQKVVEQEAPPIPEPVTKPLPLSLQATVPAKGKAMQVFSSAANSVGVQVPRSSSLPLRATMVFGPTPAPAAKTEVKAEPKPEPKKSVATPAPVRPDPRVAIGKTEAPEVKKPVVVKPAAPEAAKPATKVEAPSAPKPAAKVEPKFEPKQEKKAEVAKEIAKPKEEAKPVKAAEPVAPSPISAPFSGSSDLGLPHLNLQSSPGFLSQIPMVAKLAIVLVLLAGIGGLIFYTSKGGTTTVASTAGGTVVAGSALPSGDAGWITDWGAEQGVRRTRQISILRSSQTLTDYRIELEGQIETKAIGWIFRAADPKNFYVTKLEIVKPGLEPTVALVRFAVVNGEEQAHAQLPLPMKVRRDTMFKIRFDAIGNHFTTYVQDQKVDDWTDDRVKTGGAGLYSERGEVASLKGGMSVVPLVIRK